MTRREAAERLESCLYVMSNKAIHARMAVIEAAFREREVAALEEAISKMETVDGGWCKHCAPGTHCEYCDAMLENPGHDCLLVRIRALIERTKGEK